MDLIKTGRIHDTDIAAVAVKVLTEEGHNEKTYYLTGPEALSTRSMVKQISEIIGKPIELIELTEDQARQDCKNQGFEDEFIDYFFIEMGSMGY